MRNLAGAADSAGLYRPTLTIRSFFPLVLGLMLVASGFKATRLDIGGLRVHALLLVMLLGVPAALRRIHNFPRRALVAIAIFGALFSLSVAFEDDAAGEILKVFSAMVTIVVTALWVRNTRDLRAGAIGLVVSGAILALLSVVLSSDVARADTGLDALGNRNAVSLYTLPSLAFAGAIVTDRARSRWVRLLAVASSLLIAVAIFNSGNRSGWLGVAVVILMLAIRGRSVRASASIVAVSGVGFLLLTTVTSTEVFKERLGEMREGHTADGLRQELFIAAIKIGLENPLLGVSQQRLPFELAKHVDTDMDAIESHNAVGALIGGSGFPCFFALLAIGVALWRRPAGQLSREGNEDLWLLRTLLVLYLSRGLFSREVLFVPSFALAIGFAIGAVMLATQTSVSRWASRTAPGTTRQSSASPA